MLPTSVQYQEDVKKGTRSSTAQIYFGVYDVTAKDDAEPIVNTKQPFTSEIQVKDNVRVPEMKAATFEPDYFKLDGSFSLMPDDVNTDDVLGWWTGEMSDENCDFLTPPELTFLFDEYHSSQGLGLFFGGSGDSYCKSFDVSWYDGDVLLAYELVESNDSIRYNILKGVLNYNKVVVRLFKTDEPYRYGRLMEVNFGVEEFFDSSDIIEASVIEEVDPSCGTLSVNKLRFTVHNKDQKFNMLNPQGLYAYLQQRQQLIAESGLLLSNGSYEFVPMGIYYLSDWKNATGLTATLEATDVMGVLDRTTYYNSPFWINEQAENVLRHILNDAGNFTLVVDSLVASEIVNGYIPIMSHREALHYVLVAIRATLRDNRDGIMRVFRADYDSPVYEVDYNITIGTPAIEQKPFITAVNVTEYSYELSGEIQEIYNSTFELLDTETVVIPFDSTPVYNPNISVTGSGSIVGEPVYSATSATVTLQGTGTITVTITGQVYKENTKLVTAKLPVLPGSELPQAASVGDNKLITKNASSVAQHILDYYQKRIKQTFDYAANPAIQSGDAVEVQTMFGENKIGVLERQEITFAPNLRARMEVTG